MNHSGLTASLTSVWTVWSGTSSPVRMNQAGAQTASSARTGLPSRAERTRSQVSKSSPRLRARVRLSAFA